MKGLALPPLKSRIAADTRLVGRSLVEMEENSQPLIGVLAIQGDYGPMLTAAEAGARTVEVRKPEQLAGLDGLAMPGGESTTMLKFLERDGFFEALRKFLPRTAGLRPPVPVASCWRAKCCSRRRESGALDATVERNAYGRQIDSTIQNRETKLPGGPLEMVFIRAPRISRVGKAVEVLAEREGYPVLVRQANLLAATFHPEMSTDRRVQKLFLDIVRAAR